MSADSNLLLRVREAVSDVAWYDDAECQTVRDPISGGRTSYTQRRVSSPGWRLPDAEAVAVRVLAAGLNAEVVVDRESQLDPDTLEWGPRTWRVQVME